jgi:hypothetical protein
MVLSRSLGLPAWIKTSDGMMGRVSPYGQSARILSRKLPLKKLNSYRAMINGKVKVNSFVSMPADADKTANTVQPTLELLSGEVRARINATKESSVKKDASNTKREVI